MGKRTQDTIDLATGPYKVTAKNSVTIAEQIKYRHYKPDELEIAKDFIRQHHLVGTYYFDYYLMTAGAEGIAKSEGVPNIRVLVPWMQRIDAVVFKGPIVFIIEFKDRIRSSGVGELLTYKHLWIKQYGLGRDVKLVYVARVDDPTFDTLLVSNKITKYIVPASRG